MSKTMSCFGVGTLGLSPAYHKSLNEACLQSRAPFPVFHAGPFNPESRQQLVVINGDDPDSISQWRSIHATHPRHRHTPVLWLGACDSGQTTGTFLRSPATAGRLLAALAMTARSVTPIREGAEPAAVKGAADRPAPGGRSISRALIVGSDLTTRVQLKIALQGVIDRVDFCHDDAQAFDRMRQHRYDLAFVDIAQLGMRGYEIGRRLRGLAESGQMAIVLLSGHSSTVDMEQGRRGRCETYLIKPIRQAVLKGVVRGFVRSARAA